MALIFRYVCFMVLSLAIFEPTLALSSLNNCDVQACVEFEAQDHASDVNKDSHDHGSCEGRCPMHHHVGCASVIVVPQIGLQPHADPIISDVFAQYTFHFLPPFLERPLQPPRA